MYQAIVFLTSISLTTGALLFFRGKRDKNFGIFLKVLVFLFCGVGFFRFMLSDSFISVVNGIWYNNVYYEFHDHPQLIARWGYYISYAVLPMAVFFKSRFFRNVASYVCLFFAILSTIFFKDYMEYFLSPGGNGLHLAKWFRYAYFIMELTLAISIPLLLQIHEKHYFHIFNGKEWLSFLVGLPLIAGIMMPVYAPQAIIGYTRMQAPTFGIFHLAWIACTIAFTLILYYSFRFKNYQQRYMLCVFLTLVLFFHYDSLYLMGFNIERLPVQLCNIASYFYLIAIPLRLKKMFHFCFLTNIVGGLIAIIMPDFPETMGYSGFWTIHFIFEHTLVIAIPALAMGLRIFPRLNKKSLLYMLVGFTIYFVFVFVSGTILNGYASETGHSVNYFFMLDLKKAFEFLPFLTFSGEVRYEFGRFEVYPLVITIVYLGFQLFCLIFYAAMKVIYRMEDDHLQLRLSSITLYEELTGKKSRRPKEFID